VNASVQPEYAVKMNKIQSLNTVNVIPKKYKNTAKAKKMLAHWVLSAQPQCYSVQSLF
jgi:hypothetical protein